MSCIYLALLMHLSVLYLHHCMVSCCWESAMLKGQLPAHNDWSTQVSHHFRHMTGPVWLGQFPVTDGRLGQRLTSVSSFSSSSLAFSVWRLSEPATPPLIPSPWPSCTVATIGSICQPHGEVSLSTNSAYSGQVPRLLSVSSSHPFFLCHSPFFCAISFAVIISLSFPAHWNNFRHGY